MLTVAAVAVVLGGTVVGVRSLAGSAESRRLPARRLRRGGVDQPGGGRHRRRARDGGALGGAGARRRAPGDGRGDAAAG